MSSSLILSHQLGGMPVLMGNGASGVHASLKGGGEPLPLQEPLRMKLGMETETQVHYFASWREGKPFNWLTATGQTSIAAKAICKVDLEYLKHHLKSERLNSKSAAYGGVKAKLYYLVALRTCNVPGCKITKRNSAPSDKEHLAGPL